MRISKGYAVRISCLKTGNRLIREVSNRKMGSAQARKMAKFGQILLVKYIFLPPKRYTARLKIAAQAAAYTPEIIERIWLALTEKGQYAEFLLSLYQFGCAKITNCFGEYDVVLPALQNADKASALAAKHGIRLLSVPAEINPK